MFYPILLAVYPNFSCIILMIRRDEDVRPEAVLEPKADSAVRSSEVFNWRNGSGEVSAKEHRSESPRKERLGM